MTAQPEPAPDSWLHRLPEVRESGDRRATLPLVSLLLRGTATCHAEGAAARRPPDDEMLEYETLEDVADALCVLEDPRCEQPLEAALLDVSGPWTLRAAALRVLSCLPCDDPPPLRVAGWLRDADGLVRAHAAGFLGPRDEEWLAALVRDPVPEVRRAAAEALVGATRTPALVGALRHALRDPDAIVRETACRAALFDEPVGVTYDLLHLLDDPDGDVRCGVYDALEDYPCASVLLALADARSGTDGALAAATLDLLVARVGAALRAATGGAARRILRWATPARWLLEEEFGVLAVGAPPLAAALAAPDADARTAFGGLADARPAARPPVDVGAARRVLADADVPAGAHRDLLVSRDWSAAGNAGLTVLAAAAQARLWSERHGVAVALLDLARSGVPGASDALLALTEDAEPVVRRVALHALTHAREPRVVPPALAALADDRARAIAGDAALAAVASLAPRAVAERAILAELTGDGHDRDGLRLGAVHLAERSGLTAAAPALAALVSREIVGGPSVHVAALRALRTLHPSRAAAPQLDLAHLEGVDHLDVQAELGAWDWHGPRYG